MKTFTGIAITLVLILMPGVAHGLPQVGVNMPAEVPQVDAATHRQTWVVPQPPESQLQLPETPLSGELLSIDELLELGRNASKPRQPKQANPETAIQLSGYQQDIPEQKERKPSPESPAKPLGGKAETSAETEIIDGGSLYAEMSMEELRAVVNEFKESIKSEGEAGDPLRASQLQKLTLIGESLLKYNEFSAQLVRYREQITELAANEEERRLQLDDVVEPASPEVTSETISEVLTEQLRKRQDRLEQQKTYLANLESQMQFLSERVLQIPSERAQAQENLTTIRDEVAKLSSQDDSTDNQLRQLLQELRRRAVEKELEKLDVEVERQELGARVDPIQRDLVLRDVKRLEVEVVRWEKAAKELRQREVKQERVAASQATDTAHWSLKPLAERNEQLVKSRQTIVGKIQLLEAEQKTVTEQSETIIQRRTEIQKKIDAAGLTGTNGMLLVDLRRNLQTTGESHIRLRQLQRELREINLEKVRLNEERDALSDPLATAKALAPSKPPEDPLIQGALKFVETQREYLYQLIDDFQSYGRIVSEVSESRKKLIDEINETLAYIDENALWVRSADPVRFSNLSTARQGLGKFFDSEGWIETVSNTQQRMSRRPYESVAAAMSMFVLFAINRRVKKKLEHPGESDESRS